MGININGNNNNKILRIVILSTYSALSWMPLPNVHSILLASNIIVITKQRRFFRRGIQYNSCRCNSLRTSYHSNTECVPYQRKISHLSTVCIPTLNHSCFQQSARPSNWHRVQRFHLVCKIMTVICCSVFFL